MSSLGVLRVAAAQVMVSNVLADNLTGILGVLEREARRGVDLVVFPRRRCQAMACTWAPCVCPRSGPPCRRRC